MSIHYFDPILIVDDSSVVRSVVRKLLAQLGYKNLDDAADGVAALEKISAKPFALVISDWNMEPMSGYELLERLRTEKKHADLRFIMMTADASISKVVQARHAGVSCFINKPFSAEELRTKIAQVNCERRPADVSLS
jgi:two-component system chemotaxis response regulator CheY